VQIWNISDALKTVNDMQTTSTTRLNNVKPIYSFVGHQSEGFAIDWSSLKTGSLLSIAFQIILSRFEKKYKFGYSNAIILQVSLHLVTQCIVFTFGIWAKVVNGRSISVR